MFNPHHYLMHTAAIFVLLSYACEHSLSLWGEGTREELSVFSQLVLDSGAAGFAMWLGNQ